MTVPAVPAEPHDPVDPDDPVDPVDEDEEDIDFSGASSIEMRLPTTRSDAVTAIVVPVVCVIVIVIQLVNLAMGNDVIVGLLVAALVMLAFMPVIIRRTARQRRKVVRFGETGLDLGGRLEVRWPQVRSVVVLSKDGVTFGVAVGYTTHWGTTKHDDRTLLFERTVPTEQSVGAVNRIAELARTHRVVVHEAPSAVAAKPLLRVGAE